MTRKEIFELSDKIANQLVEYQRQMIDAILVYMNKRGFNEINLRKMRDDSDDLNLIEAVDLFDYLRESYIVDIYDENGETLECYIDRLTIKDNREIECVFSGVQDINFESTESLCLLNVYDIMTIMEWVAEYFDVMDKMVSENK